MSQVVSKLNRFGLLNETPSPAERAFVADVDEETTISPREVMDLNNDPDGATIFSALESTWELAGADLEDLSTAQSWMTSRATVKGVAVLEDALLQWDHPTRIVPTDQLTPSEAALVRSEYVMRRAVGDLEDHGVYLTRNGLLPLSPTNGGWADSDSDNTPDGYTETNLNSTAWNGGTYEAFVDTSPGEGSLNVTIPFPLDGATVELSAQHAQIHDDGTQVIRIEALNASQSVIGSSETTALLNGRKGISLETPANTYFLKCYPCRVTGVSANTTKFQIEDPCLRVDGSDQYVPK